MSPRNAKGRVLELGCGTGRISLPLARAGVSLVGVDRSAPHAGPRGAPGDGARADKRRRARTATLRLVRGDIRALPFAPARFRWCWPRTASCSRCVRDRILTATLDSVARVLKPGGLFGIDLVPDVPNWREYREQGPDEGPDRGRRAPDARRIGAPGPPPPPDDLRAGLSSSAAAARRPNIAST